MKRAKIRIACPVMKAAKRFGTVLSAVRFMLAGRLAGPTRKGSGERFKLTQGAVEVRLEAKATEEMRMHKFLTAGVTALALTTSSALAGGLAPVIVEDDVEVIEQDPASSVSPLLVIGLLILIGVLISRNNEEESAGAGAAASDARLKTDIHPVGTTADGLTLYQFRYIGLPMVYEGVMAQDVLSVRPDAVIIAPGGYMAVDYGKLGLTMKRVD